MRLQRSDGITNDPTTEERTFFRVDNWWRERNRAYLDGALDASLNSLQRDLACLAHVQEEVGRLEEKEVFMRQHQIERVIKEAIDG